MTRVAYFDAAAGIAGDMCLGALVDAGLNVRVLQDLAGKLDLGDLTVATRRVEKGAVAATKVDVLLDGKPIGAGDTHAAEQHGRHLSDVLSLLGRLGDVGAPPLSGAAKAFEELARAEAQVHGTTVDAVHFHEVGAADALVDIAGTCVGLFALGVERVFVSALPWGHGVVRAAHGTMPLPAPATAILMQGHPTFPSDESFEQVTPTGAALVGALAEGATVPAGFVPEVVGHGAGDHPGGRLPNVLRLVIGTVPGAGAGTDDVIVLETNLDDASGQVIAHALERVLAEGALDAWIVPVTMKKGRAGAILSVLARPGDVARLEAVIFRETPTLGIRRHAAMRTTLARREEVVTTPWGDVRVKVRETPDGPAATPEYEDCRKLADAHGVPLPQVLDAAARAWSGR